MVDFSQMDTFDFLISEKEKLLIEFKSTKDKKKRKKILQKINFLKSKMNWELRDINREISKIFDKTP